MRSRLDDVDPELAVGRALGLGLCGIGGRLSAPPRGLADALRQVDAAWGERAARRLERFAGVPDGAVVWTRDTDGGFHRGVLTGEWRYDADPRAVAADLVHVRPCAWQRADPPSAVLESFSRGGRNFQRIRRA